MPRQRMIIGAGEALLAEYPDREEPAGLALSIPIQANRLGHVGVAVSRIGQDAAGDEIRRRMSELGVDLSHVQSDPDLPTGRLVVRSIGGATSTSLDDESAFDNLQWDYDLEDVAQRADAVVFGLLARRDNQCLSTIERLLDECRSAVRVLDMTNRLPGRLDRTSAMAALRYADGAVIDRSGLGDIGFEVREGDASDQLQKFVRRGELSFVVVADPGAPLAVHTCDGVWNATSAHVAELHDLAVVSLLHGVLRGLDFSRSLQLVSGVQAHAQRHPAETVPQELLAG